jgi:hypothetical protein
MDKTNVDYEVECGIALDPRGDERAWTEMPVRRRSAIVQAGGNVNVQHEFPLLTYPRPLLPGLQSGTVPWRAAKRGRHIHVSIGRYGVCEGRRTVQYIHKSPMMRKARSPRRGEGYLPWRS